MSCGRLACRWRERKNALHLHRPCWLYSSLGKLAEPNLLQRSGAPAGAVPDRVWVGAKAQSEPRNDAKVLLAAVTTRLEISDAEQRDRVMILLRAAGQAGRAAVATKARRALQPTSIFFSFLYFKKN